MASVKSPGYVLQRIPYSDSSLILKVFTADSGVVSLMAKGARRGNSKIRAVIDFFLLIQWVYPNHARGEILTLLDASLMEDSPTLRRSPLRQAVAQVWLETLLRLSSGAAEAAQLFDWLRQHLEALEQCDDAPEVWMPLHADFLLGFCALSGYAPQFQACVHCGSTLLTGRLRIDLELGGPICGNCSKAVTGAFALSQAAAQALDRWQHQGWNSVCTSLKIATEAQNFLLALLSRHTPDQRRLRSLEVLETLQRGI